MDFQGGTLKYEKGNKPPRRILGGGESERRDKILNLQKVLMENSEVLTAST